MWSKIKEVRWIFRNFAPNIVNKILLARYWNDRRFLTPLLRLGWVLRTWIALFAFHICGYLNLPNTLYNILRNVLYLLMVIEHNTGNNMFSWACYVRIFKIKRWEGPLDFYTKLISTKSFSINKNCEVCPILSEWCHFLHRNDFIHQHIILI